MDGSLDRAGQAHYLRGNVILAAEYARWLRRQVGDSQPLVFADESFSHIVPLEDDASAARILELYAEF